MYEVRTPELKQYEGITVAQIAETQNKNGVDAFLDVILDDGLEREFTMTAYNRWVDRMTELLSDPAVLIGLGDGGAHVDMLCDSGYPTFSLGTWIREREIMSLEQRVRRLTSDPADFYGIKDRSRLAKGFAADIAVFDPSRIGSGNRGENRYDLPAGGKRIVMASQGVEYEIVNGQVLYTDGVLQGKGGGQVLRS